MSLLSFLLSLIECFFTFTFWFCFSLLFLFPSGLRSQVRFALCPAATYSSRAAVSATGRVHDKAIWLMTGRGGHCRKPPAGVERSVPRRLGLLAFCALKSGYLCLEERTDTSQDRGHRGGNEGDWCHDTFFFLCICFKSILWHKNYGIFKYLPATLLGTLC